jgi:hypothetical protein
MDKFFWSSLYHIYVIWVHSFACHVTRGLTHEEIMWSWMAMLELISVDSCHVSCVAYGGGWRLRSCVVGRFCSRCVRGKHIVCFSCKLRSCRRDVRIRFPRFLICMQTWRVFLPSYDKMTILRWGWTCLKLVKIHSSIPLGYLIFQAGSSYHNLLVMVALAVIKNVSQ